MLEKLLRSILACPLEEQLITPPVPIVIMDNDADKTAEEVVGRLQKIENENFALHYHDFPIKGLANVRNELLEKAFSLEPDYIIFIDDDEYVPVQWLNEMVKAIVRHECDFASGPVYHILEKEKKEWIAHWFESNYTVENEKIDFIETCNLIMSARFLQEHQLSFDERFNSTGGEDSYFGVIAMKKGAKIYFSNDALCYETIPDSRANLNWLTMRTYRSANTYTIILLLEKEYLKVIRKMGVSMVNLLLGLLTLPLFPFPLKYRYYGIFKMAAGLGSFAALLNLKYHEYK